MAEFLLSVPALERNARILRETADAAGAKVLVALKAFATTSALHYLSVYADGACASGLYESQLAAKHVGAHIAVYSPAYSQAELLELLDFAHHIDFNSLSQWERYRALCTQHPRARSGELQFGLRVNPCFSTSHTPLYDPCATGSRLGVPVAELTACEPQLLVGISGLHMHTLCEQYTTDLISTVAALEKQATPLLASPAIRYLNLGGGHWITKPDYDRGALVELILRLKQQYGVQVYLEPGEAWCIHTGVLRSQVLDIFEAAGHSHAILDVSVSAHMPDVLEMPYRPCVFCTVPFSSDASLQQPAVCLPEEFYHAAGVAGELPHTYRLGARTCLAGDVLGDFSFPRSLAVGDTIIMDDMAHYTIVKTTHFNGVPHPDIALLLPDNSIRTVRHFTFRDFADRLG